MTLEGRGLRLLVLPPKFVPRFSQICFHGQNISLWDCDLKLLTHALHKKGFSFYFPMAFNSSFSCVPSAPPLTAVLVWAIVLVLALRVFWPTCFFWGVFFSPVPEAERHNYYPDEYKALNMKYNFLATILKIIIYLPVHLF